MVDPHEVGLEVMQQLDAGAIPCVNVFVDHEEHVRGFLGRVLGAIHCGGIEHICGVVVSKLHIYIYSHPRM
jgi:hypothetical protein